MEKEEVLKNIYDDTTGWLKFIEVKLTTFLTFETGLFYFIGKLYTKKTIEPCFILGVIGVFISIIIILNALLPTVSKSGNPLYFITWKGKYTFPDNINISDNYERQIKAMAIVTERKMQALRCSMLIYVVAIIICIASIYL